MVKQAEGPVLVLSCSVFSVWLESMPYLELRVCSKSERPLCFCLSLISGGEDQGAGVARRRSHGDRNVHSRSEDSGRSWEHSSSHRTGEEGTAREAGWLFKNSFHFSFPQALILLCTRHTLLSVLVVVVWDLLNDLSISASDCVCVWRHQLLNRISWLCRDAQVHRLPSNIAHWMLILKNISPTWSSKKLKILSWNVGWIIWICKCIGPCENVSLPGLHQLVCCVELTINLV